MLGCTACEDKVLGNLFEKTESDYLEKIWEHSPILNSVRSKEDLKGECGSCEFLEFCGVADVEQMVCTMICLQKTLIVPLY
ncbi:hypothetical protein ACVDHH_14100 [Staphylococcus saprophyticus]